MQSKPYQPISSHHLYSFFSLSFQIVWFYQKNLFLQITIPFLIIFICYLIFLSLQFIDSLSYKIFHIFIFIQYTKFLSSIFPSLHLIPTFEITYNLFLKVFHTNICSHFSFSFLSLLGSLRIPSNIVFGRIYTHFFYLLISTQLMFDCY